MKQTILTAGIGGQGVQVLGKLLAYCANAQGLHVTMDAKYSGNMRGAPSNCTVIISDRVIGSPIERRSAHLIACSQESLNKLLDRVAPGGAVWRDTTLAPLCPDGREDILFDGCPATALAEALGERRSANMVMAGYAAERLSFFDVSAMRECLPLVLGKKPQLIEQNFAAFDRGVRFAREAH